MKILGATIATLLLAALSACATSHVLVGTQRPAISPEQVRVYLQPPAHYETVALLDSSSQGSGAFTSQQKTDKVMSRLKSEAASLGANGILLQGIGSASAGSVSTMNGYSYGNGFTGTAIGVPIMIKQGSAVAIFATDSGPQPSNVPQTSVPSQSDCVSCQSLGKH